eukprot:7946938-Pyramimonas_sp.AAC.2
MIPAVTDISLDDVEGRVVKTSCTLFITGMWMFLPFLLKTLSNFWLNDWKPSACLATPSNRTHIEASSSWLAHHMWSTSGGVKYSTNRSHCLLT